MEQRILPASQICGGAPASAAEVLGSGRGWGGGTWDGRQVNEWPPQDTHVSVSVSVCVCERERDREKEGFNCQVEKVRKSKCLGEQEPS